MKSLQHPARTHITINYQLATSYLLMFHLDTMVSAADCQASCDLEGEAAILNVESGTYYSLTGVGSRIWRMLQQPRTVREIRDTILGEYAVDPQRCQQDIVRLLEDMQRAGIVEQREPGDGSTSENK